MPRLAARTALFTLTGLAACGQQPADYAPAALVRVGLHDSLRYVADVLVGAGPPVIAHPRLGQAAVRRAGEAFEVAWAGPDASASLVGPDAVERPLALVGLRDDRGVRRAQAAAPSAPGAYALCLQPRDGGAMHICTNVALFVVAAYAAAPRLAHVSDVHAGDGESAALFGRVVDALNALAPPPDLVVLTGDCADQGRPEQRAAFLVELERLRLPSVVITGNHDFDARGVDGFLVEINPDLDFEARYGPLRVLGVSSGQDLDDGNHSGTISESDGPDASQMAALEAALARPVPSVLMLHHPLFNGLFGTVGPARDRLLDLLDAHREAGTVRAVLAGHTHYSAVFDGDGVAEGLSPTGGELPSWRWPLHHTARRATNGDGGYALIDLLPDVVRYRWVGLPSS